ncbi:hypothetical protein [Cohnella sp. WQ 127256]|uniref:hypothetical protein n=1 Tax=Cohnella sp. WQ 127256 TaxID=2938790 RepID=UPI0021187E65|nr:hypothetical protein [Cohnella sp. WQ 127256]
MKKLILFIVLVAGLPALLSSCKNSDEVKFGSINANTVESTQATESSLMPTLEVKLPPPYSLVNINNALEEYINYRLWLYPAKVKLNASSKNFDPYIGQAIEVEVRVYEDNSGGKKVFAQTNIGEWLVEFKIGNGIVYCDGQISKEDIGLWPEGNDVVVGSFEVQIKEPHKPNYGTSTRKDAMITAAEKHLKDICDDLLRGEGGDIWVGTTFYLEDFYEYTDVVSAWLVRPDGYVWLSPMYFTEDNDVYRATGMKGFGIDDITKWDRYDLTRYAFDKGTQDAVRKFTCNG